MDDIERMPKEQAFWFGWGLATLVASTVLLLIVTLGDSVHVTAASQQNSLTFGWPADWLTQNQSSLDPPLPFDLAGATPGSFLATSIGRRSS